MGLLRALNPLCVNVTAPRHRTARAVEALARTERDNLRESNRAALAELRSRVATPTASIPPHEWMSATKARRVELEAAAIAAMQAAGITVPAQDLAVLARRQAQVAR